MELTSPAFENGGVIPKQYSGEGGDVSPPLEWERVPEGVQAFALVVEDPDAPQDEPFVHWVLYDIPGDRPGLAENSTAGGTEGQNSFGNTGYGGPMPPPGHGLHHYHFRLYALSAATELGPGASKEDLLSAIEGKVEESAELVGTYQR